MPQPAHVPAAEPQSLTGLMRSIYDSTRVVDPDEFVKQMLAGVTPEWLYEHAKPALRDFVVAWLTRERSRARSGRASAGRTNGRYGGNAGLHERLLRMPVCIGGNIRKAFGDCTRDDLAAAAGLLRADAERGMRRAEQYDALAGILRRRHAATVRDLPSTVLLAWNERGSSEGA
jgi:hypothetical protein